MFKFKGISSKDMQVVIEEEEHFIARASRRYETTEIEGRDGAIFEELGYSYVERPIYVQCLNIDKIDEILTWLDGEGEFEYKNRKTTARFYSELEPQREGYIRIIDTTFIRDPFWTKLDDEYIEVKERKDKTTEKSNSIIVKDSSNLPAKIDVYGTSSQKTRSGKNKFNVSNLSGSSITDKDFDTSSFILQNTWANQVMSNANLIKNIKPSTQYICTADVTLLEKPEGLSESANHSKILTIYKNGTSTSCDILETSTTEEKSHWQVNTTKKFNISFTTPSDLTDYRIIGYTYYTSSQVAGKFKIENMMIREATEDDEFEIYGASPSPEFQSEIENTGDNINLINKNNPLHYQTYGNTVSNTVLQQNNSATGYLFECEPNTEYTISRGDTNSDRFRAFCFDENPVSNLQETSTNGFWADAGAGGVGTSRTFKTTKNSKYIYVLAGYNGILSENIKAEKGNKATSYSDYNCGNTDIAVRNKNLFDEQWTGTTSTNFILVFAGQKYIYSESGVGQAINYRFYENLSQSYETVWVAANNVYIPEKDGYIKLNKDNSTKVNCMLEIGEQVSNYVAHEEQLITFPFQENQRMCDKDYLASDGIHHVKKQIELVGTENWFQHETTKIFGFALSDIKTEGAFNSSARIVVMSNYFKAAKYYQLYYGEVDEAISGHDSSQAVELRATRFTTIEELKTWLTEQKEAGTPVILEYELAEEEIEPYTEEQQEVYNKLQNVLSYKTVTNVFTDKAQLVFKYIADTTEKITNEGNVYSRPILRLEKTIYNEVDIMIENSRFQYDFNDEEYVEIDCEEKEVKYEGLNRNRKIQIGYEFPKLKAGENEIKMYGGDCIIKAKRKDRWL